MSAPIFDDIALRYIQWRAAHPGRHDVPTAEEWAEMQRKSHEAEERAKAARTARLALEARRAANPMWRKVAMAIAKNTGCSWCTDEDIHGSVEPSPAADDVMDVVYGEGRW